MKRILYFVILTLGLYGIEAEAAPKSAMAGDGKPVNIIFDRSGAIYHLGDKVNMVIDIDDTSCAAVTVALKDIDDNVVGKIRTYARDGRETFRIEHELTVGDLGYYYVEVEGDGLNDGYSLGFGVIPDVTLKEKDWNSPFGVCGHYQRYKRWMIGDVQQMLGIAWVRDEADWYNVVKSGQDSDPYLDYLDSKNICWLALFNYVDAYNGSMNSDGVWEWDKEIGMIKKYVEMHKGRFQVYESQNEPNNFGGWSKRWPHPDGQQWRPQGWGKPFADLLKQMYLAVKQADSTVRLMWPGEEEWVEYFVKERNSSDYIDLTSIHPYVNKKKYPETETFAAGRYESRKKELSDMGVPDEIWATELGWSAYKTDKEIDRYMPVTEFEQAAFLVRSYLLHLYNGASKVFWYEMNDEPFGEENPESYFGIIRYNSMLTVKPSAVAYANMVKNYRYAVPVGKFKSEDSDIFGFAYREKDVRKLCLWRSKDNGEIELNLPHSKKLVITDIFGRSQTVRTKAGKAVVCLGIAPATISGISEGDFETLYSPR